MEVLDRIAPKIIDIYRELMKDESMKGFYKKNTDRLTKYIDLINEFNLKSKSKEARFVLPRMYLISVIRLKTDLTTTEIGRLFNIHHSTVCYNVKKHLELEEVKDSLYYYHSKEIRERVDRIENDTLSEEIKDSLVDKILSCKNYHEMVKLQNEVKEWKDI